MFLKPVHWSHEKPVRTRNKRRKALYGCKQPWKLETKNGEQFDMPCRRCGPCMGNRKNDIIGRCLAQAISCYDVWVVTLTYDDAKLVEGEENGAEERLPGHIKAMMHDIRQRARRAEQSLDLKYFAVYEEGSQKERGHWHVVMFWGGDVADDVIDRMSLTETVLDGKRHGYMPKIEDHFVPKEQYKKRLENPEVVCLRGGPKMRQYWQSWRHGLVTVHSLFRGAHAKPHKAHNALEYCAKYCLKHRQRYLMSQNMGQRFFMRLVLAHVASGLQLHDLTYSFRDQSKMAMYNDRMKERRSLEAGRFEPAKPRMRVYQVQGVMRDRCIRYLIRIHRRKVKDRYREMIARTGQTVRQLRGRIQRDMSLQRIGSETCVWQWQRMRYQAAKSSPVLEKLEAQAQWDAQLADELAEIGWDASQAYRNKNRVDYGGLVEPPEGREAARKKYIPPPRNPYAGNGANGGFER